MSDSRARDHASTISPIAEDDGARLGLVLVSTAVFGLGAALGVLWTGGTLLAAFLAYMAGGWLGLLLALLALWRRDDGV